MKKLLIITVGTLISMATFAYTNVYFVRNEVDIFTDGLQTFIDDFNPGRHTAVVEVQAHGAIGFCRWQIKSLDHAVSITPPNDIYLDGSSNSKISYSNYGVTIPYNNGYAGTYQLVAEAYLSSSIQNPDNYWGYLSIRISNSSW
ncbi:MAG: hypothetical protein HC905_28930 [Bacteroidales bacterium]|nr:hypothetical protein [Bacteroidales bacterium]